MSKLKQAQMDFIVQEAARLFVTKSINEVTMSDIANEVGVGEATLYRYFGKKQNITVQAAILLARKAYEELETVSEGVNGFDKLSRFYNIFLDIYKKKKKFYIFIYQFDAFLLNEKTEETYSYEDALTSFKTLFDEAYNEGLRDGSIKKIEDIDTFYFATTHSLLNLCKKLSCEGELVHQDDLISKTKEIEIMTSLILEYIKA